MPLNKQVPASKRTNVSINLKERMSKKFDELKARKRNAAIAEAGKIAGSSARSSETARAERKAMRSEYAPPSDKRKAFLESQKKSAASVGSSGGRDLGGVNATSKPSTSSKVSSPTPKARNASTSPRKAQGSSPAPKSRFSSDLKALAAKERSSKQFQEALAGARKRKAGATTTDTKKKKKPTTANKGLSSYKSLMDY